jgi:hypothetical protein
VYLSTYISPIWTLIISAMPMSLIVILAVMQISKVDNGRVLGTLVTYFLAVVILLIVVGTWAFLVFFVFPDHKNPRITLWGCFSITLLIWIFFSIGLVVLYLRYPPFMNLILNGKTMAADKGFIRVSPN